MNKINTKIMIHLSGYVSFAMVYGMSSSYMYTVLYICVFFHFAFFAQNQMLVTIHLVAARLVSRLKTLYIRIFWNVNGENELEFY